MPIALAGPSHIQRAFAEPNSVFSHVTRTKTLERLLIEALFADDCALMAHKENHLQVITDKFSEAAKLFGLTISLSKTEVLLQPAPASSPQQPSITIDDTTEERRVV